MALDISHILAGWPYKPGQVSARRIRGEDGKDKIQLRLDLGLLQMEVQGRPDGKRPHGYESYLAYYEHCREQYLQRHGEDGGFYLDERACELLRNEAVLYYHRYLAEFVLEDYEAVARDTARNLRVMDFCNRYAREPADRHVLEQYRAYVIMMNARARSEVALLDNRPKTALGIVRQASRDIKVFLRKYGDKDAPAHSSELAILKALAKEIEGRIPVDPIRKLQRALRKAVGEERYEDAAALRDQIQRATRQRAESRAGRHRPAPPSAGGNSI